MLAQPELAVEQVAAAAMANPAGAAPAPPRSRWSNRLIFGWATVAACVIIGVALLRLQTRESKLAQFASKQTPAQATANRDANSDRYSAEPAPPAPADELSAKLEPAAPLPRPNLHADKDLRRETTNRPPAQMMNKKLGAPSPGSGQTVGALTSSAAPPIPQSSEQVTVNTEVAEVAATPREKQGLPLQTPSSANEVTSQSLRAAVPPPPAAKTSAGAAANAEAPRIASYDSVAALSRQQISLEAGKTLDKRKKELAQAASNSIVPARWSISSDGSTLLRSTNDGRSWQVVNVASNLVFRAVAAVGPEVWAGGKAGALYHSADLGMHWTKVEPAANGVALTADVASVESSNPDQVKLTTADGKGWTTKDGGKNWEVQ